MKKLHTSMNPDVAESMLVSADSSDKLQVLRDEILLHIADGTCHEPQACARIATGTSRHGAKVP